MARTGRSKDFNMRYAWLSMLMIAALMLALTVYLMTLYKAPASRSGLESVADFFAEFPMHFHSNNGVFGDGVKYYSKGYQYDLLFKNRAVLLNLYEDVLDTQQTNDDNNLRKKVAQLGIEFVASSANLAIKGIKPAAAIEEGQHVAHDLAGKERNDSDNQYTSHAEATAYLALKYSNVFPGIDVYFHGKQKQLFYDFVLMHNANTNDVRVKLYGMNGEKIGLDIHGNISVECNGRKMHIKKPNVYRMSGNQRQLVSGYFFVTRNNELRFKATESVSS